MRAPSPAPPSNVDATRQQLIAAIHALICNAADHRPRYTVHLGSELAAIVQTR
jgi:hypothetical protein